MYNIVEKIYGSAYSPSTSSRMRYDIDMHVDAFLMDNKDNPRGPYYNLKREQMIPRQLLLYTKFRTKREGKSIKAWIGYALQDFLSKSQEETKTFITSS